MTTIKQRITQLPEILGFKKEEFYKKIGMAYSSFKGKSLESALSSDSIVRLMTLFPELNLNWIMLGDGEPIIENESILSEPSSVYHLKTDNNELEQFIPLYRIEATAGIVELFKDHHSEKSIGVIQIPNIPKCDGALYISGDSMYPLLKSGDIVLYKQTQGYINGILFFGEMYLIAFEIDGEDHVAVKWIHKSEKGDDHLKLVSENKHHQAYDIPKASINAMALIKASIRVNSMN